MGNFRVRWTGTDGKEHTSVVSYSKTAAERRKRELEDENATAVEVFPVKPGE